jgi:hypothetical protein
MSGAKSNIIWRAAAAIVGLALVSGPLGPAVAAEKWDLYIYNPVSTVAAVKGLNTVIEQIDRHQPVRHSKHLDRQAERRCDGDHSVPSLAVRIARPACRIP